MKIALVYPPTRKSVPSILPREVESSRGAFPPLGILYLAAQLQEFPGVDVLVRDADNQGLSAEEISREVMEKGIELIGITVLSFHLLDAMDLAERIKRRSAKTRIIAGGPHPHIFPEETLKLGVFDYVALGEAEDSLRLFLEKFISGNQLPEVEGILSANNFEQKTERQLCAIMDLDKLKFPARELLGIENYFSVLSPNKPATTAISSRGCPYKCVFCDRPHLGKRFRARSAENVVAEMERCAELGIREVIFYDDNFTTSRERVLKIAELLLERKLKIAWDVRARVGDLKPEDYVLLKRAGLARIHFGVESGDPDILEAIKKGITIQDAREAFISAHKAGIETLAYFMIGLPGENETTLSRTIDLAMELKPDYVHFSMLMLFPGTPIYSMALERGIIKDDVWRKFAENPGPNFQAPVWEENLKRADMEKALNKAYRKFYLRPGYLASRLSRVRSWHSFKTQARMGMSILGLKG